MIEIFISIYVLYVHLKIFIIKGFKKSLEKSMQYQELQTFLQETNLIYL